MDRELLGRSLAYHGTYMLDQLRAEEQLTLEDVIALKSTVPIPVSDEPQDTFDYRLVKFIAKKADLLFCKGNNFSTRENNVDTRRTRYCAVLPPLEYFMEVSRTERRQQLFRDLERGDLVVGTITALHESGFTMTLLALDGDMARDVVDLKPMAFCPLREIPKTHAHENALEAYSIKDKVRAVVVGVNDEKITVSLQRRALVTQQDATLGTITDDELPPYYRAIEASDSRPYGTMIREAPEFRNPLDVSNMAASFGLGDVDRQPSLMRGLFKESDYADKLRKEQSYRLAMRSVADGVEHFKHGRTVEAMQMLNKALHVDNENVEALVARGALYANSESFRRALENFDAALNVNPNHANARKYACDTLLALGRSLLETGDTEGAISRVYRASLLQPNNPETTNLLAEIQRRMLNPETVESTGSADEEDSTILVHAKESLVNSLRKDTYKKGRSRTMTNESKSGGRKRSNSESSSSSSDITDSKRRAKKSHSRKEGNDTSDSDSVAELEWIPRDATGSYCELVGSTKSDIRKGYDINLVNPERMQSAVGNSVGCPTVYGPAAPPGESAKNNKIVTTGTDRNGSTSSSKSSSSSSSSSSNGNTSPELSNKKGNQQRKTNRSSSAARRKSIKSSKKPERISDRSTNNDTRKRESGVPVRHFLSSRNQERRRSRDRSIDKKSVAKRRDSRNSGISKRTDGKKRESSTSSFEGRDNVRKRRSSGSRRENSLEKSRRTSFDHSRNKNRIYNEPQLSQPPCAKARPLNVANKSADGKKMTTASAVVDKTESDEKPSLSVTTDKKVDKSTETLEDMEAFLKQLKAQSKLKAVKK